MRNINHILLILSLLLATTSSITITRHRPSNSSVSLILILSYSISKSTLPKTFVFHLLKDTFNSLNFSFIAKSSLPWTRKLNHSFSTNGKKYLLSNHDIQNLEMFKVSIQIIDNNPNRAMIKHVPSTNHLAHHSLPFKNWIC